MLKLCHKILLWLLKFASLDNNAKFKLPNTPNGMGLGIPWKINAIHCVAWHVRLNLEEWRNHRICENGGHSLIPQIIQINFRTEEENFLRMFASLYMQKSSVLFNTDGGNEGIFT